jgi:uncharacterized membrane protein YcaP (DUF421 family)
MDIVVRAAAVYLLLLLVIRASGKRSLAQLTAFDFVLLLVIGEATQQAMMGNDYSITAFVIAIVTLIALHQVTDLLTFRSERADRLINGAAVVLVEDGRFNDRYMRIYRITRDELLAQARSSEAVERLEQIRYAVLERTGAISIIPKREPA